MTGRRLGRFSIFASIFASLVWGTSWVAAAPPERGPEGEQIIEGVVSGPQGPLADAAIKVTLRSGKPDGFYAGAGEPRPSLAEMVYSSGPNGGYRIEIPAKYAHRSDVNITAEFFHPGYLERSLGPSPLSDFDGRQISTEEAYWLHRQMNRAAMLRCRLREERRIGGTLLLANGEPAVGATIVTSTKYQAYSWKFHNPDDYGFSDRTTTDEQGKFALRADQQFSLTATLEEHAPLLLSDFDKRIPIANGDPATTLRLPEPIRVQARVLDSEGRPIPRAIVLLQRNVPYNENDMPLSFRRRTMTDEQGICRFAPVPAGPYKLSVGGQVAAGQLQGKQGEDLVELKTANEIDALPFVFVPRLMEIAVEERPEVIELRAEPVVKLNVQMDFPDGPPDPDRHSDIGIEGKFRGQPWRGRYEKAGDDGQIVMLAPKGLTDVRLKTGLARHRLEPSEEFEIGEAIHLGTLEADRAGIVVSRPELATLKVQLQFSDSFQRALSQSGGRVSISAWHEHPGYREHSPKEQKLWLVGSSQHGQTKYRGTALPLEPLILSVTLKQANEEPIVLHEARLVLEPGEEHSEVVPIN